MLRVLLGRSGAGKSAWILDRIWEIGDRGEQILMVPEHASHQAEVDLCRVCGDTASRHAEVLSFRRLGDRVLSLTGGAAQVALDAGGKLLTLQRCVAELVPALTVYRRPSRKAAFLSQLLNLFDEMRSWGVTPDTLADEAPSLSGSTGEKLRDLSLLYAAYEGRLRERGRDARDHMSRLCDGLDPSGYVRGKDVFFDGFTYFNAQERRVLAVCLRQARSVTVALQGEENSREEVFAPAIKTLDQLRRLAADTGNGWELLTMERPPQGPLGHLERFFFTDARPWEAELPDSSPDTAPDMLSRPIRLREARTALEEAEQAAADIRRLAFRGLARYREIAVAVPDLEEYQGVLETVFRRWDIPFYLNRRTDILEKPAMSLVTGVLAAVTGGYAYEEMFRWLKTGLAGLTADECDLLENYVLKWDIHGQMWIRDVDWTGNPDGYGQPMNEKRTARLAAVNVLRRRVREPLAALAEGLKQGETAGEKVDALYTFLERLSLREALEARMHSQAQAGRLQDAEETAQLWELLCGVLDQFTEILGPESMDTETFAQLIRQILTQYSVGTIPVSLDQVSVSDLSRNDRRQVKYLFLLGANDHVLPGAVQSGGILNADDRRALAERGLELAPTGMERMEVEMQILYSALSKPTAGLLVSYPVADAAGADLRPSFVAGRLLAMFPGTVAEREGLGRESRLTAPVPALETAGQGDGPLRRYFTAAAEAEPLPEAVRLLQGNTVPETERLSQGDTLPETGTPLQGDTVPEAESIPPLTWRGNPLGVREKLAAMDAAASLRRGALSPRAVRTLYGDRIGLTASRLERLRTCHFSYFMQYGLRARPRTAAAFDAPQIGTFLHYLLEHVTRDVLAMGGFASVDDDELRRLVSLYMDRFAEEVLGGLDEKPARFRYLFQRLRGTALKILLRAAEELRHSDFIPLAFELSFGDRGAVPGVVIREADGEGLRIGGQADRVDGWIQGDRLYLRVVDYKSGRKKFDLGAVRMGLDIQMLLYLFVLERNGKAYFAKDPAYANKIPTAAGVLYFPARDDILSLPRDITPEELQKKRETAYRRSGLVLSAPDVLRAMEHEALDAPHYLPALWNRDGSPTAAVATAEEMGRLGRYVERLVREMGMELRRGCIDADPCCENGQKTPCRYCDWAAACHFQDGRDRDRLRFIPKLGREAFWEAVQRATGADGTNNTNRMTGGDGMNNADGMTGAANATIANNITSTERGEAEPWRKP